MWYSTCYSDNVWQHSKNQKTNPDLNQTLTHSHRHMLDFESFYYTQKIFVLFPTQFPEWMIQYYCFKYFDPVEFFTNTFCEKWHTFMKTFFSVLDSIYYSQPCVWSVPGSDYWRRPCYWAPTLEPRRGHELQIRNFSAPGKKKFRYNSALM